MGCWRRIASVSMATLFVGRRRGAVAAAPTLGNTRSHNALDQVCRQTSQKPRRAPRLERSRLPVCAAATRTTIHEIQQCLCPGHGHVREPPLFVFARVVFRDPTVAEAWNQTVLDSHHKDDWPFPAFRAMDGAENDGPAAGFRSVDLAEVQIE
jgi:hypothetical protein